MPVVKEPRYMVLSNSLPRPLSLILEPWGDTMTLNPNSSVRVKFEGPSEGGLEIEYSESGITIFGWPGSTVSIVLDNDEELGRGNWPRGPAPGGAPT